MLSKDIDILKGKVAAARKEYMRGKMKIEAVKELEKSLRVLQDLFQSQEADLLKTKADFAESTKPLPCSLKEVLPMTLV